MLWLLLAFLGPVLWAASTHIDKYLVEKFFKHADTAVLLVFTALICVVPMPLIWALVPEVTAQPPRDIAAMTAAGLLYMGALFFYLRALQGEEASVIAPLFQASPLFVYALAFLVLGEKLTPVQMGGGLAIMASAAVAAFETGGGRRGRFKARLVLLMLACALAMAASSVIFKLFALRDQFWITTFWMFAGETLFGAALMAVPSYRKQFFALFKKHPGAMAAVNGANELINLGGGLAARYASLLGPLAIVQAIGSTTPIFVFAFGVALSLLWPKLGREDVSRRSLVQKGIAVLLMAVGVALIGGAQGP